MPVMWQLVYKNGRNQTMPFLVSSYQIFEPMANFKPKISVIFLGILIELNPDMNLQFGAENG